MNIEENIRQIRERIKRAAEKCGRDPEKIKLIAVTKGVPLEKIEDAIKRGLTTFGENYIQEAIKKIEGIKDKIEWHFIGHLQTNKAKYAVGKFELIHSVDSIKLAAEIDKVSKRLNLVQKILIQVNTSGENTKSGVETNKALDLIKAVSQLDNIKLLGLMTMPPYFENPLYSGEYFKGLRKIRDIAKESGVEPSGMTELSMGMSNDFEIAVEEGATMLRIGTLIFGPRE